MRQPIYFSLIFHQSEYFWPYQISRMELLYGNTELPKAAHYFYKATPSPIFDKVIHTPHDLGLMPDDIGDLILSKPKSQATYFHLINREKKKFQAVFNLYPLKGCQKPNVSRIKRITLNKNQNYKRKCQRFFRNVSFFIQCQR